MKKAIVRWAGVFFFSLAACGMGWSQADESTATVRGTVYDATGAVLPGATVTATNPATGVVRSTVTGANGQYLIPQLNPATYQIQASAAGFEKERANEVVLTVGQIVTLDGHLIVGAITDTVEVNGDVTPLIDVEQTQQANTLNENAIQYLPNASRNLLTEVFTLPGVGSTAGAQAQNQGFYFQSTQVSVGSSNGRGNLVTVNSGEDDYGTGAVRFYVPLDAIQEAQVNRNGYQAEFGFASGAAINYITKSGTNRVHGDLFGVFDDRYTNSQNYLQRLNNVPNAFSQDFFGGGSIGVPLLRDKLFAFGSYEFQKTDNAATFNLLNQATVQPFNGTLADTSCFAATPGNPITNPTQGCFFNYLAKQTADPADQAIAQAYIANTKTSPEAPGAANPFYPLSDPNLAALLTRDNGTFNTPFRNHKAIARFDYQAGNQNTYTATFSLAHGSNYIGSTAPDGAQNPTRDYESLVDWAHIFSPSLFNKFLFQFAYNQYNQFTPSSSGPEINIQGLNGPFGTLGHNFASTYYATEYRYEIGDSLSLVRGSHSGKAGFSYRPANYYVNNPNYAQGEFDFYPGFGIGGAPLEKGVAHGGTFPNGVGPGDGPFTTAPYPGGTYQPIGLVAAAAGFCPVGTTYCIPASTNYSAPQTFALQVPYSYESSTGNAMWSGWANYAGAYAQDMWKIRQGLTLSYGARIDLDGEPSPLSLYKFFSPRVGLAWAPYSDQRTVIRVGGGVFVAPTNFLEPLYTNLYGPLTGQNNYLTTTNLNISQPNGSYGQYGNVIGLYQASVAGGSITTPTVAQQTANHLAPGAFGRTVQTLDPHYTNQKTYQASASVAQQIGRDYSVELSYIFYRGNHLASTELTGYTASNVTPDPITGPLYRQDAAQAAAIPLGAAFLYSSNGNSIYHGGTVALTKRYSQHIQASANYTWSRSINDATDFNIAFASYRPDGTSLNQEKGVSDFNRTHVFVATAIYNTTGTRYRSRLVTEALGNITVGPIFSVASGAPFDILLSSPFSNGTPGGLGNLQARPYNAQRNSGQGPGFDSVDLKFTKGFALTKDNNKRVIVSLDSTNLFNADNFSSVYNFFPASVVPAAGKPVVAQRFGGNNQLVNLGTGPFNFHGFRPTNISQASQPLFYNNEGTARRIQVGARFEF